MKRTILKRRWMRAVKRGDIEKANALMADHHGPRVDEVVRHGLKVARRELGSGFLDLHSAIGWDFTFSYRGQQWTIRLSREQAEGSEGK